MIIRITMYDETAADDVGLALTDFKLVRVDAEGSRAG